MINSPSKNMTLARAYIELASYIEIAKFDDPDESQEAMQYITMIIQEGSDEILKELLDTSQLMIGETRGNIGFVRRINECAAAEIQSRHEGRMA